MAQHELHNQEVTRHEAKVNRNVEHDQSVNLDEKHRSIEAANQNAAIARIVQIIYFLFSALELLLAVRLLLHLFGVNTSNGFASLIDSVSAPPLALFTSLVQNPTLGGLAVFEVTTVIAMLVWAIVGWLLGQFIWLVLSRAR
jgi:hypothetical protein